MRLILTAMLLILLTACGNMGTEPSSKLVQIAIALQIEQTQQQLSQQLGVEFKGFDIDHVKINKREPLEIQQLPAYHLSGTYDLTLKLPRQINQKHNPFDVYLQRQIEGKTWRLAIPQAGKDTNWITYLIL